MSGDISYPYPFIFACCASEINTLPSPQPRSTTLSPFCGDIIFVISSNTLLGVKNMDTKITEVIDVRSIAKKKSIIRKRIESNTPLFISDIIYGIKYRVHIMKGKLFIIATPIGNLEDISFRAVRILSEVSFVLAEDTRQSSVLLKKYSITTPLISYRDQNHERIVSKVLEKLSLGVNLALVSDSGTPVISDPGYKLIKEVVGNEYEVVPIPGANAAISALSVAGVVTDKFTFLGFLPKSDSKRRDLLTMYGQLETSLVIYESPNRVVKLLEEIVDTLGDRYVVLANDITKLHERFVRGNVGEVLEIINSGDLKLKGEFVVLVDKK
jgi:16S rRNA (cytidine1402-2'-O)-methyltransferase